MMKQTKIKALALAGVMAFGLPQHDTARCHRVDPAVSLTVSKEGGDWSPDVTASHMVRSFSISQQAVKTAQVSYHAATDGRSERPNFVIVKRRSILISTRRRRYAQKAAINNEPSTTRNTKRVVVTQ